MIPKTSITTSQQKECRAEHCFFKILNSAERCIVYCHWNINYGHDCIGRDGHGNNRNGDEIQLCR